MKIIILIPGIFLALQGCNPADKSPKSNVPVMDTIDNIIDLTYSFGEETIYWPTAAEFHLEVDFKGKTEGGYHYEANTFTAAEHGGTHLDAPAHFSKGGLTVDKIKPEKLMGPAIVIDVSRKVEDNPDYQVQIQDFKQWESEHGRIPEGAIVLLRTGYGKYWPDRELYMGTEERGEAAVAKLHFPGLSPEAANWIVEHRSISAIGLDTPSIDYGQSVLFESHRILGAASIPIFENVAHLDKLPAQGFQVIALPMKIKGGSGAPLRIIAILNKG